MTLAIGYAAEAADAPLQPFHFERRDLRPEDVAIDILYCGVCHSDIHAARGDWHDAHDHFRQATLEWPTAAHWRAFANACKELGQSERAEDALRRAALLDASEKNGAQ